MKSVSSLRFQNVLRPVALLELGYPGAKSFLSNNQLHRVPRELVKEEGGQGESCVQS